METINNIKHNMKYLLNDIQQAILDAYNIEDEEMNEVRLKVVNNEIELEWETKKDYNDDDEIRIINIDNLKNTILNAVKITEGIIMEIPKQYTMTDISDFMEIYDIEDIEEVDTEELKDFYEDTQVQDTDRWINDNKEEIKNTIQQYIAIQNNKAEAVCEG